MPERILVLDDEEAICMLVTCALEPLGYEVTETNDGLSAIAAYQKAMDEDRPFDLVISDLTIPGGIGGQETIKRLLSNLGSVAQAIILFEAALGLGIATGPLVRASQAVRRLRRSAP